MNKFVIYTNPYKDIDELVTDRVKNYLVQQGASVCEKDHADAMTLVLGGDGTMLQAIRELPGDGPFIGVNLGNLGFLTEIERDNIEASLDRIMADDFVLEKRMLLEGKVNSSDSTVQGEKTIWALNDVVLTRCGSLKILRFEIYVNGRLLHEYLADGMIVSTPTGSTGYNLSAGGPLASPASEVILLTPICPHSLNQRSIVLSGEDTIEIKIPLSKDNHIQEMEVSFDGSNRQLVHTGDSIVVGKSNRYINIARLGKDSFLDVLNRKMSEK
ncbi:MAG: NAD(+)/NADH kinase [Lachnospiraceae bacterium]|nr:NAD(+)/NADH kinase [Lachnospiraceae bacterium]